MTRKDDELTPESIVRWGDVDERFLAMSDAISKVRKQIRALQKRVRALEEKQGK